MCHRNVAQVIPDCLVLVPTEYCVVMVLVTLVSKSTP